MALQITPEKKARLIKGGFIGRFNVENLPKIL